MKRTIKNEKEKNEYWENIVKNSKQRKHGGDKSLHRLVRNK